MRALCLVMVLAVAGLTLLGGCDGDDGGSGTLLAQGTVTVPASGNVDITTVQATAPGTLQLKVLRPPRRITVMRSYSSCAGAPGKRQHSRVTT